MTDYCASLLGLVAVPVSLGFILLFFLQGHLIMMGAQIDKMNGLVFDLTLNT